VPSYANRITSTDHDTSSIVAGNLTGYLAMVGLSASSTLGDINQRPVIAAGAKIHRILATMTSVTTRSVTFSLNVNGSLVGSSAATNVTQASWTEFKFRHAAIANDTSLVAVHYATLVAGDRMLVRVYWRG
jgi:hypothetical protein